MVISTLVCLALLLALLPAYLFCVNLMRYRRPGLPCREKPLPAVSVLIPARDEAESISAAVHAVLASRNVELEVVVLDDHSTDATAAIVTALAQCDSRVRLLTAPPLPPGWCGKQHACAQLARAARYDILVFVDADVRLAPDGLARAVGFLEQSGAELVSGVPRQETGSFVERLLIPLIHFLLLGYLPMGLMRRWPYPGLAAGCGQLFVARRSAYEQMGGHGAIRTSLHDGLTLPRAFRIAGFRTDLFDATDVAVCRMYHSARQLWHGLSKNAGEGLAAPRLIGLATLLLFGGQVLPFLLVPLAWGRGGLTALGVGAAVGLAWLPRLLGAWRFRQNWLGAALHPLAILGLLAIQWQAFCQAWLGRPATWKGRSYGLQTPPSVLSTGTVSPARS